MDANFFESHFSKGPESLELENDQDLLVFSHLRWDFVFQRPQHLMTRFAFKRRVFFIEEPHFTDTTSFYKRFNRENGIQVIVPYVQEGLSQEQLWLEQKNLINQLMESEDIHDFTSWYYTPMALPFTRHLSPNTIVWDCMDELSAFKNAPPQLIQLEAELLECADVVFTGGHALYEAKKNRHHNIHAVPSSIDNDHFRQARTEREPDDQKHIPHPRLGFYGVIDERMDLQLLADIAKLRPDWHLVLIGPVAKINPADLPKAQNIHYLGQKDYKELPCYLSGWDLAMLPFARNESTRYISPTKTPEYLAAGRPVVSTTIRDVVHPYALENLVSIADTPEDFVACVERAMDQARFEPAWLQKVDYFLSRMSWDSTFKKMADLERKVRVMKFQPPSFGIQSEQLRI